MTAAARVCTSASAIELLCEILSVLAVVAVLLLLHIYIYIYIYIYIDIKRSLIILMRLNKQVNGFG